MTGDRLPLAAAVQSWRQVAAQLRIRWPKLGNCMDDAEVDVLVYGSVVNQAMITPLEASGVPA